MKTFDLWKDLSYLILDIKEFVKNTSLVDFEIESTISKRAAIRDRVQCLSDSVRKKFNTKIAKYYTFGLVVWLDEIMAEPYEKASHPWPILQKEIFKTTEGGVTFYEYLEEIILNPFYPKFIYQFYYCMLKDGYKGMYVEDSQYIIQKYLTKLEEILNYNKEELNEPDNTTISSPIIINGRLRKLFLKVKEFTNKHYTFLTISGLSSMYLIFLGVLYV